MPRNWTERRLRARGSPSASWALPLATWAIIQRPCRMLPGSPTALANSGSMWIGLKSPEAPAYRCGRYLSGVTFSSGMESPSFSSLSSGISDSSDDVGPGSLDGLLPVLVGGDRLEDVEPLAVLLVDLLARRRRLDHVAIADRLVPPQLLRAVEHRGEGDPRNGE